MSKKRSQKRGGPEAATLKQKPRPIWPWLVGGLLVGWWAIQAKGGGPESDPGNSAGPTAEAQSEAEAMATANPEEAFDASPERIARGGELFATNCAVCHGVAGIGQDVFRKGGGQRADGSRIAPALDSSAHAWHHRPMELFMHIKTGSPLPDSPMLGWEGRLSDEEIVTIISYINSLWSDRIRATYWSRPHH